ncbi:hypothetical protein BO99DRAFT_42137 [Aspergillus violaceofuscus CBS 115571]|uniref:Uncharacterized protein n=1 Tax=Aspergillus violaceofuscus (strain CBS 115571) TaxID=1450538 RepID=A0A2V5IQ93_ASPV1|nr:hypothetical protein BO99DRAFT_42137 [Aspergillus violaceofuscus CBS 115571]
MRQIRLHDNLNELKDDDHTTMRANTTSDGRIKTDQERRDLQLKRVTIGTTHLLRSNNDRKQNRAHERREDRQSKWEIVR